MKKRKLGSGKGSNMNEARKFSVCMGMMPANFTV